jgi:hypothetical protein
MRFIILNLLLIVNILASGQTKIAKDIYMQNDPTHISKAYKNVVFKSNCSGEINDVLVKVFHKFKINAVSYNTLFPAIKEYTKEEIDKVFKEKGIDLNIVININQKEYISGISFNNYFGGKSVGEYKATEVLFCSMLLSDLAADNPFVRVDGKVFDDSSKTTSLAMKFLHKSLDGLIEAKVINKPE